MADKGGVGKTTLAFHVATRLKQLGCDVGLYDLDSRGTSSSWAGETSYLPAYDLRTLQSLAPDHAAVVWDTAPHPDREIRAELVRAADLMVIVANGDRDSMNAAAELYRALGELGAKKVRIVFNGVHPTGREGSDCVTAAEAEDLAVCQTFVRRYNCFVQARWDGCAVVDKAYSRADNAWADICAVADELLAACGVTVGDLA